MGMSRQQRRANQRRLVKSKDVQAAIEKLDNNAEHFAKVAFEAFKAEEVPKIETAAITKFLLWNMAFLRLKCGYGKKRMLQYVDNLSEFCNDLEFDKVTMQELIELLDEELGINTVEEMQKIKRRAVKSLNDRIEKVKENK